MSKDMVLFVSIPGGSQEDLHELMEVLKNSDLPFGHFIVINKKMDLITKDDLILIAEKLKEGANNK